MSSMSSLVCQSDGLYPINVKTADPIRPKFCAGPHMTLGKVYETSKMEKKFLPSQKKNPQNLKRISNSATFRTTVKR